jgi:hypothetical protein
MRYTYIWLVLLLSISAGNSGDSIKKCNFTTDLSNQNDNIIQREKIHISLHNMQETTSCWYTVKFSSKYGIKILFDDFDLQDAKCGLNNDECCQYLEIGLGSIVGENLVKKLCGRDRYFEPIYIPSNEIWFNFINNNNHTIKSYRGVFATITPFQLIYSNLMGKIKCPNYDESILIYPNNIDITFKIDLPEKYLILVNFNSIDLEKFNDTCYDYVQIIESDDDNSTRQLEDPKLLSEKIICGKKQPDDYISSSNQLKLRFRSDENITGDLFDISYRTIQSNFLILLNY